MKILIIGNGGREHALAWKLHQSRLVKQIFSTPVNVGIAGLGSCAEIAVEDIDGLAKFAQQNRIDLTVVGPEIPLSLGVVDTFRRAGLTVFGPTRAAARLEYSKAFAKQVMEKYQIPTAAFREFISYREAEAYINTLAEPPVIKADGLAAGKGVVVANSPEEALHAAHTMLEKGKFGAAGSHIIVEEKLRGPEASIFTLCDGASYRMLPSSQDHKRVFDHDQGPNTGGMGAYSPTPVVTPALLRQVENQIVAPLLSAMQKEGIPYTGLLYTAIIITPSGPKVIEFNCRFGDPETQAVLPLIGSDFASHLLACAQGKLAGEDIRLDPLSAICVVLTAIGYPGSYPKDMVITGWKDFEAETGAVLFHAGTRLDTRGHLVTNGGRVLGITAAAATFNQAHDQVYRALEKINFPGMHYRRDIGSQALE
jgi:phosphoribosylamine--glycine ligase